MGTVVQQFTSSCHYKRSPQDYRQASKIAGEVSSVAGMAHFVMGTKSSMVSVKLFRFRFRFFFFIIVTAPHPVVFSCTLGLFFFSQTGGGGGVVVREFAYDRASSCRTSLPPATPLLSIGALLCLYILNPFSLSVLILFPYFCNRRCGVRAR